MCGALGEWYIYEIYIKEQMETFTLGISTKMLMHQDYFHSDEVEELEKKEYTSIRGIGRTHCDHPLCLFFKTGVAHNMHCQFIYYKLDKNMNMVDRFGIQ